MEYVSKITILGLKMMVKSGLEICILKFLHVEILLFPYFIKLQIQNKNNLFFVVG